MKKNEVVKKPASKKKGAKGKMPKSLRKSPKAQEET